MALITSQRDYQKYLIKISKKAVKTQKGFKTAYNSFDRFCKQQYKDSGENIIEEMKIAEDEAIFDILQEWINWLDIAPGTIPIYFTHMRTYLHWRGIKLNPLDVKLELDFPRPEQEELHPLSFEEIKKLLDVANYKNRCMYICMLSAGLRPIEVAHIKKSNLELDKKRIVVHVPARYTKLKRAKTSFFSSEAGRMLKPILKRTSDDDYIFKGNSSTKAGVFARYRERVDLDDRFDSTDRGKINLMGFRAFFITKISRHDPNLAKKWAGQKGYMLQYDRLTLEEQLDKYLEFEKDLIIDSTERQKRIIDEKDRKIADIEKDKIRIDKLEDALNTLMFIANGKDWGWTDDDINKLWGEFNPKFHEILDEAKKNGSKRL